MRLNIPFHVKEIRLQVKLPLSDKIKTEYYGSLHCFGDEVASKTGVPKGIWDIQGYDDSPVPYLEILYDTRIIDQLLIINFLRLQGIEVDTQNP